MACSGPTGCRTRRLRQSLLLELHVGLKIDGGGFDRLVAQPQSNDRAVDAVLEQVHCQGMPQDMRRYVLAGLRWAVATCDGEVLVQQVLKCVVTQ